MAERSTVWKSDTIVVAAFDVGTTYSGYAFAFKNEPDRIHTNAAWNAGSGQLLSLKTSTCVLLNPSKQCVAFGFEAEDKYARLTEDEEHEGWLLFRRFKMSLNKRVKRFYCSTFLRVQQI